MKIKQRGNSFFVMDGERHVCRISCDDDDAEKIVRRFAASDEMLAVCEKLAEADNLVFTDGTMYIEYLDTVAEARDMARAAIKKTKGEQS